MLSRTYRILLISITMALLSCSSLAAPVHARSVKPTTTLKWQGFESLIQFRLAPEVRQKLWQKDYQGVILLTTKFLNQARPVLNHDASGSETASVESSTNTNDAVIEAYVARGVAHDNLADKPGAIADYTQALKLLQAMHDQAEGDGGFISTYLDEVYVLAGMTREDLNDDLGALRDYNRALILMPSNAEAYALRAALRSKLKDPKGAREDAQRLQEMLLSNLGGLGSFEVPYTNNEALNADLARAVVRTRFADRQGALTALEAGLKLSQEAGSIAMLRGTIDYAFGDYKAAIADHKQAIQLLPNDARAYYQLAVDHAAVGDVGDIIAACTQALQLDSLYSVAYGLRSSARAALGDQQGAQEDLRLEKFSQYLKQRQRYEQQLRRNPRNAQVYSALGQLDLKQNNYQRAMSECTQAIKLRTNASADTKGELGSLFLGEPKDPYECRAIAFAALGKRLEAIEDLKQSGQLTLERLKRVDLVSLKAKVKPPQAFARTFEFYSIRTMARLYSQDFQGAAADVEQMLSFIPDDESYYTRALIRLAQGDNKGAIADYTQIVNCCSKNSYVNVTEAYFFRAVARVSQSEQSGATADIDKVRQILANQSIQTLRQNTSVSALFLNDKSLAAYNQVLKQIEQKVSSRVAQTTASKSTSDIECPTPCIY